MMQEKYENLFFKKWNRKQGWEACRKCLFTTFQLIQVFAFVQIPQHGSTIFPTWGTQWTIRWAADSVQIASMSQEVCQQLQICEAPNLDNLVICTFLFLKKETETWTHPPETIRGAAGLGLKRTQDTQSVCPSSLMVYLHSPRVFQTC